MIGYKDISDALKMVGVKKDAVCLFHSSFKSLGKVEGGADGVIRGFEDAIGPDGTLVVPTLCSSDFFHSYRTWHLDKPSEVGYLTEYFRKLPNVLRSDHATHSVAARGPLAHELTFEHSRRGPHLCPFGEYAFSDSSPWMKMYTCNATVVFVGVTMKYNTMKHLIEATVTERLLEGVADPVKRKAQRDRLQTFENRWSGVWLYYNAEQMEAHLETLGLVRRVLCGNAVLTAVNAKDASDAAMMELMKNPQKWYKDEALDWIFACKNE